MLADDVSPTNRLNYFLHCDIEEGLFVNEDHMVSEIIAHPKFAEVEGINIIGCNTAHHIQNITNKIGKPCWGTTNFVDLFPNGSWSFPIENGAPVGELIMKTPGHISPLNMW